MTALGLPVLYQALVGGHQAVRMRRVHAGEDFAAGGVKAGGAARMLGTALALARTARGPCAPRTAPGGNPASGSERRRHLVAVVVGVVHPRDGQHDARGRPVGEQLFDAALLGCQLLGIRHAHPVAAAAARCHGARGRSLAGGALAGGFRGRTAAGAHVLRGRFVPAVVSFSLHGAIVAQTAHRRITANAGKGQPNAQATGSGTGRRRDDGPANPRCPACAPQAAAQQRAANRLA